MNDPLEQQKEIVQTKLPQKVFVIRLIAILAAVFLILYIAGVSFLSYRNKISAFYYFSLGVDLPLVILGIPPCPDRGTLCQKTAIWYINKQAFKNPNITEINLTSYRLREVPSEIGKLKKLKKLHVGANHITKVSSEIEKLTELEELDLGSNDLEIFPKEIVKNTNLKILDISYNHLEEIPQEISELSKLKVLRLYRNKLKLLPDEVAQLLDLEELDAHLNRLTSLPSSIVTLKKLNKLIIYDNYITFFPPGIESINISLGICPNSFKKDGISQALIKKELANYNTAYFSENDSIFTEKAQKGDGITHLARRVIANYLNVIANGYKTTFSLTKAEDNCLENHLQKKIGKEFLRVGETRVFTPQLVHEAIISCNVILHFCDKIRDARYYHP